MEINKVYNENCSETMAKMPDNFIDLTITSPPYDNLRNYNGYDFNFEAIAKELYRVTKQGGVIVWVVGDATVNGSETGTSFKQALYFKEIGFNLHDTMIWDKKGMRYPDKLRYSNCFEYMFILSKGTPKTVNLIKDRENIYKNSKIARKSQIRLPNSELKENSAFRIDPNRRIKEFGSRFNIWRVSTSAQKREILALKHPASFPEQLASDHIISWSAPEDVILDCFAGSGTTGIMAYETGRNFILIEISEAYCDIIKERFKKRFDKDIHICR